MGAGTWAPPGEGEEIGKRATLPLRLPLEIRNHDGSHLVKKIYFQKKTTEFKHNKETKAKS